MQNKLTNTVHWTRNRVNAFTLATCIAVMGFASAPAYANTRVSDTVTTRIDSYLLNSDNGARRIYKKLSKRAKNACKTSGHQTLHDRRVNDACADGLLNDFVVDLNDARVTAYHQTSIAK